MSGVKGRSGPPGQPKHELHRYRISQAKLGKLFTQEHKDAMSASHCERYAKIKSIMQEQNISYKDAIAVYKLS